MALAESVPTRTSKLVVGGWLALCATGMWQLADHATSPGATGKLVRALPAALAEQLDWSYDGYLLVLAAHPQCPCLSASLHELQAVLQQHANLTLRVLVYEPSLEPEQWRERMHAKELENLPAASVRLDRDGQMATQLGATTSGHISLFRPTGDLAFAGGITGSRGHLGDNANSRALHRALTETASLTIQTDVFGCPMQAPCDCPNEQ